MPVNFSNFTSSSTPVDTDQVVGYAVAASGGERRWTLASLRSGLIKGAATTIDTENLTTSRALVSTNTGKVGVSTVTSTELSYLDGARSNIQQQLDNSLPAGAVMAFAMSTAPNGWLPCDGREVSRSDDRYKNLFAAINTIYGIGNGTTTFNLPDLRGEFIRGWDNSRGVDPSRNIGSWQKGTLVGGYDDNSVSGDMGVLPNGAYNWGSDPVNATIASQEYNLQSVTWMDGPSQVTYPLAYAASWYAITRPRNVAMNYCIKL